ncbi:MAG: cation diffusion facilitator family transporter [Nocardioidaceae bacterium]
MSTHDHGVTDGRTHRGRLLLVLTITATVLVAEVVGAILAGSLALLADAGHMLTDVAGLAMALLAAHLTRRPATRRRTWGFHRAEVLAAAAQAALLLAVGLFVMVEGIRRLMEPPEVGSATMLVFGAIGLAGNVASVAVLLSIRGANLNLRAAFLEVVNDALGSVAVIVAAVVIWTTGWTRADAIVSMLIALLILPRTVVLLREAGSVLLETAPKDLDLEDVRDHILAIPHVEDVHDLHASQIASDLPTLTAHVVVLDSCFHDGHLPTLLDELQTCVAEHFPISVEHSTFQFEPVTHVGHETGVHL